jgi:TonB family protein
MAASTIDFDIGMCSSSLPTSHIHTYLRRINCHSTKNGMTATPMRLKIDPCHSSFSYQGLQCDWMRRSLATLTLVLAACHSAPVPHKDFVLDSKKPANHGKIQVGDFLATPTNCGMIHYVRPSYPVVAKKAHVQGVVRLRVVITKTGDLADIQTISGDPGLVPAAIRAVKKWRYAPCRLNGSQLKSRRRLTCRSF